ncbi:MAG: CHAT domain-containing protein [Planctomycetota bacterium]
MAKSKGEEEQVAPEAESAWALPDEEIDRLLASGQDPRLSELFGNQLDELRKLARKAASTETRSSKPTVVFLPGVLGSTLGKTRKVLGFNTPFNDTIWFDPISLGRGKATEMRLAGKSSIRSLGVLPAAHTFIRLRLRIGGFRVTSFHYDWRYSIPKIGEKLVEYINELSDESVMVVAHSMGGLVTRAALHQGCDKIDRVVMIGTPNKGSFSPVQLMGCVNSTLLAVDKLDLFHDAETLVEKVFSTFPSMYEMMPRPEVFNAVDLFKSSNWPKEPFRPPSARLTAATQVWDEFAVEDDRLHLIAGIKQSTVTSLRVDDEGQFEYISTDDGDGTVPLAMCQLEGVPTRFTEKSHLGLLQSESVARATIDLLNTGKTTRLEEKPTRQRSLTQRVLKQEDFTESPFSGRRGQALTANEMSQLSTAASAFSSMPLNETHEEQAELSSSGSHTFGSLGDVRLKETFISRDVQTQFDIELCQGSLFSVPYRALVLGIFQDVEPAGPAQALDDLMNGAVSEMLQRRMFQGGTGKVFVMPTGRNLLKAENVVFMGLGRYADFVEDPAGTIRLASANTLRTLLHCGVDEFATVIYGGATGFPVREAVKNMMGGYLESIQALRTDESSTIFRRLGLCEWDKDKFAEIKSEVTRFAFTDDSRDIRVRLHEPRYPEIQVSRKAITQESTSYAPVASASVNMDRSVSYLSVRVEELEDESGEWLIQSTLMTSGGSAAVYPSKKRVDSATIDDLVADLPTMKFRDVGKVGEKLKACVFNEDFVRFLENDLLCKDHLVVVHNPLASRIPWEIIPLCQKDGAFPCIVGGLSRRHEAEWEATVAKHVSKNQEDPQLNLLMVVDPSGDLPGAVKEAKRIRSIAGEVGKISIDELPESQATREAVLSRLATGNYDILHYAGHAFFDPFDRRRSGLVCADEVLRGEDIAKLDKLPSLVFFNACESARVRGKRGAIEEANATDKREQNIGIAETLLNAGVTQFLGTYWEVGDAAAEDFAGNFYSQLVDGRPIYEAVLAGRKAVLEQESVDFADYLHYGSPTFQVKFGARPAME